MAQVMGAVSPVRWENILILAAQNLLALLARSGAYLKLMFQYKEPFKTKRGNPCVLNVKRGSLLPAMVRQSVLQTQLHSKHLTLVDSPRVSPRVYLLYSHQALLRASHHASLPIYRPRSQVLHLHLILQPIPHIILIVCALGRGRLT